MSRTYKKDLKKYYKPEYSLPNLRTKTSFVQSQPLFKSRSREPNKYIRDSTAIWSATP